MLGKINNKNKLNDFLNVKDILNNYELSPFWPRILGNIPPDVKLYDSRCEEYLSETLTLYGINNMIIGHTPQFYAHNEGINSTCDNKLWRIDTGSSTAFMDFDPDPTISDERHVQVLEILNDNKFNILKKTKC